MSSIGEKTKGLLNLRKPFYKIMVFIFYLFIISVFLILFIDFIVSLNTKDKIYGSIYDIPKNKVGLVLGTSKYRTRKRINLYYKYRITAAFQLYKKGKIEFLIVSGDNRRIRYNEPRLMKKDLIKMGVPPEKIYLDYAGFRTFDSIVRAKQVFGLDKITVISQKFHIERAIFIAERKGIKAIGFAAKDLKLKYGVHVLLREKLARVKMVIDLIINNKPKFLGKKIKIK
jgi:SanA protein